MRRIHYADVAAASRAVMQTEDHERAALCLRMIREAQAADAHRRATGRAHPLWGSGSLMEVARRRPLAPEPGFDNAAFREAMRLVLDCLMKTAATRRHS